MVSEHLRLLPEMVLERLRLFPEMFLSERLRLLPELVSERLRLLPEILLSPSYHPILGGDFELYLVAMTVHIFSATLSSVVSSIFSRPECPARFLTIFSNFQQVIVLGRSQSQFAVRFSAISVCPRISVIHVLRSQSCQI